MITVIAGSRGMLSGKTEADNEIGQKPSTTVVISLNLKKKIPSSVFNVVKLRFVSPTVTSRTGK